MGGLVLVRIAYRVCNATNSLTNFFHWLTFSVGVHVHKLLVENNVTLLVFVHVSLVCIPCCNLFRHLGNDFRARLQVSFSSSLQDSLWEKWLAQVRHSLIRLSQTWLLLFRFLTVLRLTYLLLILSFFKSFAFCFFLSFLYLCLFYGFLFFLLCLSLSLCSSGRSSCSLCSRLSFLLLLEPDSFDSSFLYRYQSVSFLLLLPSFKQSCLMGSFC